MSCLTCPGQNMEVKALNAWFSFPGTVISVCQSDGTNLSMNN